ncbi:MAG: 16S rRNA (guanine(966)-N(2))-methyltransferase RsmD [Clostridiales bacterium]|nr:16S rRNA (guanine(966)-N(2))-methyltransferase RsmD [Clostridiales bacterium]
MRVIAGDFKGRRLTAPKGLDVRPTPERVKEAIFSMVQPYLAGAVCLDLFAGTGALGIEALSRGARFVYFCDSAPLSIAALKQNLDICRVDPGRAVVLAGDWHKAYTNISGKCNLVFIDAPYDMCVYYSHMLQTLASWHVLEEGALVVLERDAGKGGYALPGGFEIVREKRYGSVGIDLITETGEGE